jgi:hypothetical protein
MARRCVLDVARVAVARPMSSRRPDGLKYRQHRRHSEDSAMHSSPTAVALRATIQRGGTTAAGIEVAVPPDLASALAEDPEVVRRFEALSYSLKRRHVLSVEGAKTDETRRRRIAETVETLRTAAA